MGYASTVNMNKISKISLFTLIIILIAKIAEGAMYYRKGKYETKYATLHFDSVDDVYDYGQNLSSGFFEFNKDTRSQPSLVMDRIDGAVETVAKKLNIGTRDLSRFKVDIVIVRNLNEIASIRRTYDKEAISVMNTAAFYVPSKHVIYTPLETDIYILRHELAHALQYRYYGSTDEQTARKYQGE